MDNRKLQYHTVMSVRDATPEEREREYKWDLRFLELARTVSTWSKDPSTKVGAVIVRPDMTVCSVGFNGFPRGCTDDAIDYANRDFKYRKVIHAELNALLAAKEPVKGYTLYTWPPGYGPTCERCAVHVIQSGIARVVGVQSTDPDFPQRWKEPCMLAAKWYEEASVQCEMLTVPEDF